MKLKRVLLSLIFVCFLLPQGVEAQSKTAKPCPNRIKVAYGDAVFLTMASTFVDAFLGDGELSSTGSLSVGYRRFTRNASWAFGADLSFTRITEKNLLGDLKYDLFTVVPTAEFYYLKSGIVRLYGTAGVGAVICDQEADFAFQVNPIAIRVGTNRIAGFLEAGVGYKGVVNLGLEVGF
ncbi:MAG: hypothetical protein RR279_06425 [Alistipes sp.]